jgi:hypothetical protein
MRAGGEIAMNILEIGKAVVAGIVLLGFIIMFSYSFIQTYQYGGEVAAAQQQEADAGSDPAKIAEAQKALKAAMGKFNPRLDTWATAVAGLVGTIVATLFGQEVGKLQQQAGNPTTPDPASQIARAQDATRNLGNPSGWREWMSLSYFLVYLFFGLIAVVFLILFPYCPDTVKNLATISGALILAIARAAF